MNAVLNYTGSVAALFPMGIDMGQLGASIASRLTKPSNALRILKNNGKLYGKKITNSACNLRATLKTKRPPIS